MLAPSDLSSEFGDSCGKCFEIKCRQEPYTDAYGNYFDNVDQCHNTTQSLVARVVDACPCDYPGNRYSNKRWCCQDSGAGEMHADLSVWAFERLGRKGPGSMALSYREVPCNYMPDYPAIRPAYERETRQDLPKRSDRRPHEWTFVKGRKDDRGKTQGSVNRVANPEDAWAPIVEGSIVYRDGTFNLSYQGPFHYLSQYAFELFGEALFLPDDSPTTAAPVPEETQPTVAPAPEEIHPTVAPAPEETQPTSEPTSDASDVAWVSRYAFELPDDGPTNARTPQETQATSEPPLDRSRPWYLQD